MLQQANFLTYIYNKHMKNENKADIKRQEQNNKISNLANIQNQAPFLLIHNY